LEIIQLEYCQEGDIQKAAKKRNLKEI